MSFNLGDSSQEDIEKWRIIQDEVFNAKNGEEAYFKIKELRKIPITDEREILYTDIKFSKEPYLEKPNFIILLTDRTTKWFNPQISKIPDDRYVLPPMIQSPSNNVINQNSKYLKMFNDTKYFTPLNNLDNKCKRIHVLQIRFRPCILKTEMKNDREVSDG